jgi:hypothetical protein
MAYSVLVTEPMNYSLGNCLFSVWQLHNLRMATGAMNFFVETHVIRPCRLGGESRSLIRLNHFEYLKFSTNPIKSSMLCLWPDLHIVHVLFL